jgi:3-dehydrotetronate 4-kinase
MDSRTDSQGFDGWRMMERTYMDQPILGCIADDLTGATDLCNNLVRAGMRVVLTVDVPQSAGSLAADAIVVALKSRTIAPEDAVAQSLAACRWLGSCGVRQIYFKISSTFDSTPQGNIGPVIEALMDELNCDFSVVVPSFPDNERTVFRGHLFVGDVLLSESGMRNHPLTPMTDANLVRFLGQQLYGRKQRKVGLIDYRTAAQSANAIRERIDNLRSTGVSVAIADAISNDDLLRLAIALGDDVFVTAGSGLAIGLPAQWGIEASPESARLPKAIGRRAVISGSCSVATNAQVENFVQTRGNAFSLDPIVLARNSSETIEQIIAWADSLWDRNPAQVLLVYSTAKPAALKSAHEQLGVERSGELVENALSQVARAFVQHGVGQLVIAGGETAGVCIRALDVQQVQIGPQIDPGVPWCYGLSPHVPQGGIHLALKSGNFGANDFFSKAFSMFE